VSDAPSATASAATTSGDLVPTTTVDSPLAATTARGVVQRAADVAGELARVIDDRRLFTTIRGKRYVHAEGWATLGAMIGILPREVAVVEDDGDFVATVELVRISDGAVVGRGSASCGTDERDWAKRPKFQRRSMALTRAVGKAYRMSLSWIVKLAGFEVTPVEDFADASSSTTTSARSTVTIDATAQYSADGDDLASAEKIVTIKSLFDALKMTRDDAVEVLHRHAVASLSSITAKQADQVIADLRARQTEAEADDRF
jgi:hypothetical protein